MTMFAYLIHSLKGDLVMLNENYVFIDVLQFNEIKTFVGEEYKGAVVMVE